jgi:hypothetical protein
MSDDEFAAAGGNKSMVHTDFTIGSGEVDVDGFREAGTAEPIMHGGDMPSVLGHRTVPSPLLPPIIGFLVEFFRNLS